MPPLATPGSRWSVVDVDAVLPQTEAPRTRRRPTSVCHVDGHALGHQHDEVADADACLDLERLARGTSTALQVEGPLAHAHRRSVSARSAPGRPGSSAAGRRDPRGDVDHRGHRERGAHEQRREDQHPAAAHERPEHEAEPDDQQADRPARSRRPTSARKATPAQIEQHAEHDRAERCRRRRCGAAGTQRDGAGSPGTGGGGSPTVRSGARRPRRRRRSVRTHGVVVDDPRRRRGPWPALSVVASRPSAGSAAVTSVATARRRRPRRGGGIGVGGRGSGGDRRSRRRRRPGAAGARPRAPSGPSGKSQCRAGDHQSPQNTLIARTISTMPKTWVPRSLRSIGGRVPSWTAGPSAAGTKIQART